MYGRFLVITEAKMAVKRFGTQSLFHRIAAQRPSALRIALNFSARLATKVSLGPAVGLCATMAEIRKGSHHSDRIDALSLRLLYGLRRVPFALADDRRRWSSLSRTLCATFRASR